MAQGNGVLRARKDGGTSICHAPSDKVGHRKCCHVMSDADIKVRKEGATMLINISGVVDNKDTKFDIKANEKKVKKYISNLSAGLSKEEKESILKALQNR